MIPYGRQDISEADIQAVVKVLRSDFLTQGPVVPALNAACQTTAGPGMQSPPTAPPRRCTSPASRSAGQGSTSCGPARSPSSPTRQLRLYCGAESISSISIRAHIILSRALAEKLEQAERERAAQSVVRSTSAANPATWRASTPWRNATVSRSSRMPRMPSARYQGEPIGNCRYSDITVFSFHPVKIITTGEGGMALTNDAALPSAWHCCAATASPATRP